MFTSQRVRISMHVPSATAVKPSGERVLGLASFEVQTMPTLLVRELENRGELFY